MELPITIEVRDLNVGIGVFIAGRGVITDKKYVDAFTKYLKQDHHKLRKYRYCFSDWTAYRKRRFPQKQ